jgi:hypothetical protein
MIKLRKIGLAWHEERMNGRGMHTGFLLESQKERKKDTTMKTQT